jgi:osmotically-inducible protein OsmY
MDREHGQRNEQWASDLPDYASQQSDASRVVRASRSYIPETGLSYDEYRRTQYVEEPVPLRSAEAAPFRYRRGSYSQGASSLQGASTPRGFRPPKNYTRSDERVREEVCEQLGSVEELDPSDIEVTVSAGQVTLSGSVRTRQMKYLAEEIAVEVFGVSELHNTLRVAG